MVHEIIHLAELLAWGASSCAKKRFQSLAGNIFGHTGFHHDLVSPHEDAAVRFGVGVGSTVAFEAGGARLVGVANGVRSTNPLVELTQIGVGEAEQDRVVFRRWDQIRQSRRRGHATGVANCVNSIWVSARAGHRVGRVNRINRRATVLVEAAGGVRYSDGRRYHKYYVPPEQLTVVNGEDEGSE